MNAQMPHLSYTHRDLVPLGRVRGAFNFSLDDKRVLNQQVWGPGTAADVAAAL
jgi:hypothetical protein